MTRLVVRPAPGRGLRFATIGRKGGGEGGGARSAIGFAKRPATGRAGFAKRTLRAGRRAGLRNEPYERVAVSGFCDTNPTRVGTKRRAVLRNELLCTMPRRVVRRCGLRDQNHRHIR